MNVVTAAKKIKEESGLTFMRLAQAMGYKRYNNAAKFFEGTSMTVDSACKLFDALGYEIIVQPKRQGRRADGQIVLTRSDEDKEAAK